jgi:hypothetical protein
MGAGAGGAPCGRPRRACPSSARRPRAPTPRPGSTSAARARRLRARLTGAWATGARSPSRAPPQAAPARGRRPGTCAAARHARNEPRSGFSAARRLVGSVALTGLRGVRRATLVGADQAAAARVRVDGRSGRSVPERRRRGAPALRRGCRRRRRRGCAAGQRLGPLRHLLLLGRLQPDVCRPMHPRCRLSPHHDSRHVRTCLAAHACISVLPRQAAADHGGTYVRAAAAQRARPQQRHADLPREMRVGARQTASAASGAAWCDGGLRPGRGTSACR